MQAVEIIYLFLWVIFVMLVFYFGAKWIFPGFYRGVKGGLFTWWKGMEETEEGYKRRASRWGLLIPWEEIEEASFWAFSCNKKIKQLLPTADTLIVGCEDKLYFLDKKTGETVNEYDPERPFRGMALNRDDLFLFLKGEVLSLPPYFLPRWRYQIHYDNFLLDAERIFLWDSIAHKFHCLDKATGKELWSRLALLFFNFYDWTQDDENIYTIGGRWVIAWRKMDGKELWRFKREEWSIMSGRAGGGKVYLYDHPYDCLFCLTKDGVKLWEKNVGRSYWTFMDQVFEEATLFRAALLPLGRGVILITGGEVYLFHGDTGEIVWRSVGYIPPGYRISIANYSPLLYQPGEKFLYFMVNFQIEDIWWVYRARLSDGQLVRITRSPAITTINADDKYLYIGTYEGNVFAISKESLT